jgi:hypothetical protein
MCSLTSCLTIIDYSKDIPYKYNIIKIIIYNIKFHYQFDIENFYKNNLLIHRNLLYNNHRSLNIDQGLFIVTSYLQLIINHHTQMLLQN